MVSASYQPYTLHFKSPVLTSRGKMQVKNGYFLFISDGTHTGTGECSFIEGLSRDDLSQYKEKLDELCRGIASGKMANESSLENFPSIRFAYETALRDFETGGEKMLFKNGFTSGKTSIPINGLVWMGSRDFMLEQINQKLNDGFRCIKIKVGAIDFEEELSLLGFIRKKFPPTEMEIRLDANGAFSEKDVFEKMERLAKFNIHSIEQPVKPHQYALMEKLCAARIIPVALDEELIELKNIRPAELLRQVKPQYLILKPSLLGGWKICEEWIELADQTTTGWWVTSALESNIGLNAIAQWIASIGATGVQGLGTGGLYSDNISSPLYIKNGELHYDPLADWGKIPVASGKFT